LRQGFYLKFIFSEAEIIETPYIVVIKQLAIRLVFNGSNQLLQFIEIDKFDSLNLVYKNRKVGGLTLKNIYNNAFGPTYPGEVRDGHYILSYPGISFKFTIPHGLDHEDKAILMKLLEKDLVIQTIVVHHERNWNDVYQGQIAFEEDAYTLMNSSSAINKLDETIGIERLDCIVPLGKIMIRLKQHPEAITHFELVLKKTLQQDILAVIGPPDEVFVKNDSRLNIHNGIKRNSDSGNGNEIFHNYFRYGFDILYDISDSQGSKIRKLIIHNNLPNSLFFQKYKKCIWRMIGTDYEGGGSKVVDWSWKDKRETGMATSEMYFSEIPKSLKQKGHTSPIILNRSDLLNTSLDSSIEFVTIDETDIGKSDNKSWGQSLIYAYERCIWEVLSSNNAVNSVTLY